MAILKRPSAIMGPAKHTPAGGTKNRNYVLNTQHVVAQSRAFHPNTAIPRTKLVFK
jgi:hypothetical protein